MPPRQSSAPPTTAPPTTPFPTATPTASKTSPRNPIGVPYYLTDPTTGLPLQFDQASGRPVSIHDDGAFYYDDTGEIAPGNLTLVKQRWTATVAPTPRFDSGPLTPGEQQRFITGGGPLVNLVTPQYFEGDEWVLANAGHDVIAQTQASLVSAGLLKAGSFSPGYWDPTTKDAFKDLLAYANATGSTWQEAGPVLAGAAKERIKPVTVKVTNPEDLRKAFKQAVIGTLGQGWDTAKIDQMVAAYQATETGAQQQAYSMQDTGGTVTAPPDPATFAETQARAENPSLAGEHDLINTGGPLAAFRQMLGGWQ